jgi:lysophospholipase L1-like esterase
MTTARQHPTYQYSTTYLWFGLIAAPLLLAILLESLCLGILYINDSVKGVDTGTFAERHLLTRLFVSTPPEAQSTLGLNRQRWELQIVIADDLLGWHFAPDVSAFNNSYLTDHNGFIVDVDDPQIELQKPVDTYRVIILGGSTVVGVGATRPSQNIVGMLRKGIRERGLTGPNGKRVEVINAGVTAYNSAQEYLYLVSDLLRFRPDLVIAYDGWNDSTYDLENYPSPFRTAFHTKIQSQLTKSYSIAGSLVLVAQNLASISLGMIELPRRVFNKLRSKTDVAAVPPSFDPRSVELYDINRRAFLALADDQLSVALFLQPLVGVDDRPLSVEERTSWWSRDLDQQLAYRVSFYQQARQVLAHLKASDQDDRGHHCIADLSHSLKGVSEPVYADTGHLLAKGNEVVAARILDQLVLCEFLH